MPRGRMLNKSISYHHRVAKLPLDATLLFTWMIPHLDVKGRIQGEPGIVKGTIVPYIKELTIERIIECLKILAKEKLIRYYRVKEMWYIEAPGFLDQQTIHPEREAKSIIPTPIESAHEQLMSNSSTSKVKLSKVKLSKDNVLNNLREEETVKDHIIRTWGNKYGAEFPYLKGKGRYDKLISDHTKNHQPWVVMAIWNMYLKVEKIGDKILSERTIAGSSQRGHPIDYFFNNNIFGELQDDFQKSDTYKSMAQKYKSLFEEF